MRRGEASHNRTHRLLNVGWLACDGGKEATLTKRLVEGEHGSVEGLAIGTVEQMKRLRKVGVQGGLVATAGAGKL